MAVEGSEQPFKDYWASTIYPMIKEDYERLMRTRPIRMAEKEKAKKDKKRKREDKEDDEIRASVEEDKIMIVVAEARDKGERRASYATTCLRTLPSRRRKECLAELEAAVQQPKRLDSAVRRVD